MVKHTKQVIAVADASKLGMISAMQVCLPGLIHTIITDCSADAEVMGAFERQGVRVVAV